MNWIEESKVDIRQYNGESLCEMLADKIWDYHREEWLKCPEFIQNACFLIDFDTELNMEGILTILKILLRSICRILSKRFGQSEIVRTPRY